VTREPIIILTDTDPNNAVSAMTGAVERLRGLSDWDQWITIFAQGQGCQPGEPQFSEIQMRGHRLDVGARSLNVAGMIQAAGTSAVSLAADGDYYSVAAASAPEVARLLDAIFRHHFGLRPFAGDADDYLVGAEWRGEEHALPAWS
jgi:hypothetical protein